MSLRPHDEAAARRAVLLDIYGLLLADGGDLPPNVAIAAIFDIEPPAAEADGAAVEPEQRAGENISDAASK